jgi:hypothetical protein
MNPLKVGDPTAYFAKSHTALTFSKLPPYPLRQWPGSMFGQNINTDKLVSSSKWVEERSSALLQVYTRSLVRFAVLDRIL